MLDVSDCTGQIVVGVDTGIEEWLAILQQENKYKDWHECYYEGWLWNNAEKCYVLWKLE